VIPVVPFFVVRIRNPGKLRRVFRLRQNLRATFAYESFFGHVTNNDLYYTYVVNNDGFTAAGKVTVLDGPVKESAGQAAVRFEAAFQKIDHWWNALEELSRQRRSVERVGTERVFAATAEIPANDFVATVGL
jgi:hypothetical protein